MSLDKDFLISAKRAIFCHATFDFWVFFIEISNFTFWLVFCCFSTTFWLVFVHFLITFRFQLDYYSTLENPRKAFLGLDLKNSFLNQSWKFQRKPMKKDQKPKNWDLTHPTLYTFQCSLLRHQNENHWSNLGPAKGIHIPFSRSSFALSSRPCSD